MIHNILKKFIIFLLVIKFSYGYNANSIMNLSSIEERGEVRVATYKFNILSDDIFPLQLQDHDESIILEDIQTLNAYRLGRLQIKFVTITVGNNTWNMTTDFFSKNHYFCKNLMFVHEINMDRVLNEAYRCENHVNDYIGRFYIIQYLADLDFIRPNGIVKEYIDGIKSYWLITQKKKKLLNNKWNLKEFLKDCNAASINHNLKFYITVGILISIIILTQVIFWMIKSKQDSMILFRRKIHPISEVVQGE